jgi:hypothetical protein
MYDPLLRELAIERHQELLREAEHWRLIKTVTAARPSMRSRIVVTLGSWLIQGEQVLTHHAQPAAPALVGGPPDPLRCSGADRCTRSDRPRSARAGMEHLLP